MEAVTSAAIPREEHFQINLGPKELMQMSRITTITILRVGGVEEAGGEPCKAKAETHKESTKKTLYGNHQRQCELQSFMMS